MTVLLSSVAIGPLALMMVSHLVAGIEKRAEARVVVVRGHGARATPAQLLRAPDLHRARRAGRFRTTLQDSTLGEPVLVIGRRLRGRVRARRRAGSRAGVEAANRRSETGAGAVLRLLRAFNQEQATLRLAVRGVSPALLEPMRVEERDLADPAARRLS